MMTGRGAPVDPAPRIAYELGAAAAAGDDAAVAALWDPLDDGSRARVLAALGSQARSTAHAVGADPAGATVDLMVGQALDVLADLHGCEFALTALHALAGRPLGGFPACDGCPRPAVALAWARLRVLQAIGFSAPALAEMSRRAAYR